jgi:hypothetical protein
MWQCAQACHDKILNLNLTCHLVLKKNCRIAEMALENNEKFQLKVVQDSFVAALHEDDDVELKSYLNSYEELNK